MHAFRLRGFHPLRRPFPRASTKHTTSTTQSYNPHGHARGFGLFRVRSPLLTESLLVFFSSAYLDVSVRRVRDYCLPDFIGMGCPIRTSTDQGSFAPPRCFSQLTASFVASGSQGIPHAPLVCFLFFDDISCKMTRTLLFSPTGSRRPDFPVPCLAAPARYPTASLFPSLVNELFLVEDIGFEPMTPSLQS